MRTAVSAREVSTVRVLMISTELMLSCACAVLLMPLQGECWRGPASAVQMAATGGVAVVDVGRLMGFLTDNLLPVCIERLYLGISAILFAVSGGLALASDAAAAPELLIGGEDGWDARDVGRATLAFFTMVLLIGDAAISYLPVPHEDDVPPASALALPAILGIHTVAAEEPPPSYAVVVASQMGAHQTDRYI